MKKTAQDLLSIGAITKRSGLSIPTIQFYEEKGLIYSIRTNGKQRRYVRHMLKRLALIKVAQKVGLSLQEIQQALAILPEGKVPTRTDWQKLSRA
ncbi:MerR family transcriptional regulator [Acinetobacter qingfengensis]|uniref:MerR family transcriptional regulator n=1 Tax=Acinetobacter qingfengensis TaxID=1262585 RepID=UPI001D0D51D9|nr:MerR family transcriptional regulator [Acinetobacter qingfengensis]